MLASLLPGVRELRVPLATGYLWLINAWLAFGDRLPKTLPDVGPFSQLRALQEYSGKAGLAVAVSFLAYLVGSFLEMNPLRLWEHGGRPKWINWVRGVVREIAPSWFQWFPVSDAAKKNLVEDPQFGGRDPMELMILVTKEEQQLATRLHANNVELYNKYERLLSESAFRLNVAPPLVVLALLLLVASDMSSVSKALVAVGVIVLALLLFRQAVKRAIQSRDVLVQALVVDVVKSRALSSQPAAAAQGHVAATAVADGTELP
jgi:hypothetical protein